MHWFQKSFSCNLFVSLLTQNNPCSQTKYNWSTVSRFCIITTLLCKSAENFKHYTTNLTIEEETRKKRHFWNNESINQFCEKTIKSDILMLQNSIKSKPYNLLSIWTSKIIWQYLMIKIKVWWNQQEIFDQLKIQTQLIKV